MRIAHMKKQILLPLAILALIASASNQVQRKTATPTPPEEHAVWLPAAEEYFGLTQETFRQAGLSKLTSTEYGALLTAMRAHEAQAAENAKMSVLTYSCGSLPPKDSKIKIIVEANVDAPSEIMSPLRQRIRSMSDVEIVFNSPADFGMSLLPMAVNNTYNYKAGYAASVVTWGECQASIGTNKWPIRIINNHWVFTAGDAGQIVNSIVTSVDTGDIEQARKLRAALSSQAK
jgi:hypothetical protein